MKWSFYIRLQTDEHSRIDFLLFFGYITSKYSSVSSSDYFFNFLFLVIWMCFVK